MYDSLIYYLLLVSEDFTEVLDTRQDQVPAQQSRATFSPAGYK
jgi:hypothetical protein